MLKLLFFADLKMKRINTVSVNLLFNISAIRLKLEDTEKKEKKRVESTFYFAPAENALPSVRRNPWRNQEGAQSDAMERKKGTEAAL